VAGRWRCRPACGCRWRSSGGRPCFCDTMAIASVASARPRPRRPQPLRARVRGAHRRPAIQRHRRPRVPLGDRLGRGAPRRRIPRSSEVVPGSLLSFARGDLVGAPAGDVAPTGGLARGAGARCAAPDRFPACARARARRRTPAGAPVRGGPEWPAPDRGAADLDAPARECARARRARPRPSVRALADRGRPVCPALFPPDVKRRSPAAAAACPAGGRAGGAHRSWCRRSWCPRAWRDDAPSTAGAPPDEPRRAAPHLRHRYGQLAPPTTGRRPARAAPDSPAHRHRHRHRTAPVAPNHPHAPMRPRLFGRRNSGAIR